MENVEDLPKPVERKPINRTMERPDFESPLTRLEPTVNAAFKKQIDEMDFKKSSVINDGSIPVGTCCKQGGCNASYESSSVDNSPCVYHPGVPIFHEGYKFWSCCQKKTSDFSAFLSQIGCENGKHKWIQDESAQVSCRWDWHQTGGNVVVAVYAKNYDYKKSFVKVSPVRLMVKLVFPKENNSEFNIDLELRGLIDASKTTAHMFGTKVEISMPKTEGGKWPMLDFPRAAPKEEEKPAPVIEETTEEDNESDVDLDDLELVQGATIMELGELARACQLVEDS